jgi:hypothetical protein
MFPHPASQFPKCQEFSSMKKIVTLHGSLRVAGLRHTVELRATQHVRHGFETAYDHYSLVKAPVVSEGVHEINVPGHGTIRMGYQYGVWTGVRA